MRTRLWYPSEVWYEKEVTQYTRGKSIIETISKLNIPLKPIEAHNQARLEIGDPKLRYIASKKILILGIKKDQHLIKCSPSADYRIVIGTSCPGFCEYCYLADSLGERVFPRVYVNLDEILKPVLTTSRKKQQNLSFELSSSGDPLATEHLTGLLAETIETLGKEPNITLRVVTKFPHIDSLLKLNHRGNTFFRFSLNTDYIIKNYEHRTGRLEERITACQKLAEANYPLGAIIAPIMLYDNWKVDYKDLIISLSNKLPKLKEFELITYRFSKRAQERILARFPQTKLEFSIAKMRHKAFGKYVYDEKTMTEIESFFQDLITNYFPESKIAYIV